jgi:hypothetical protein
MLQLVRNEPTEPPAPTVEELAQEAAIDGGFWEGPPPRDLAVDLHGLSPARADLARFVAWKAKITGELAALEEQRLTLIADMTAEAEIEKQIAALVEDDANRGRSWLGRGLRNHRRLGERARLEAQLIDARHAGQVAETLLPELERAIIYKNAELEPVRSRVEDAIPPALEEAAHERAAALKRRYIAALEELRAVGADLMALPAIGENRPLQLPHFAIDELKNVPARTRIEADPRALQRWRDIRAGWADDPRIEFEQQ